MAMANPELFQAETTNAEIHRTAHHVFGFQQVLTAVTHALAHKEQPSHAASRMRAQRSFDKQRMAANSSTVGWSEMLLR
jgi:uncharacterized protein with von Willebrand factor type A (vWA) domain